MTFSYNPNQSTDLNRVRLLINDTNSTSPEFSDEEIDIFIDLESNVFGASALACNSLAAKYADKVNKTVGKLKIDASDKHKHYSALAEKYESYSKRKGSFQLYAGGISVADKDSQTTDTDRVEPNFTLEMHDYAGTTISSTNA